MFDSRGNVKQYKGWMESVKCWSKQIVDWVWVWLCKWQVNQLLRSQKTIKNYWKLFDPTSWLIHQEATWIDVRHLPRQFLRKSKGAQPKNSQVWNHRAPKRQETVVTSLSTKGYHSTTCSWEGWHAPQTTTALPSITVIVNRCNQDVNTLWDGPSQLMLPYQASNDIIMPFHPRGPLTSLILCQEDCCSLNPKLT